ncbi:ATP-binding protein [Bdellovibrio bacteriovorus]|uniref:histidine kinase n=1 Tax=Bdellovibrio bacteriovorus TaxID=959 RepID=A0A1Z3N680_BDEBC|nr:ATP-binding protein [Bdellovibrio bacteriovorus]ASD62975.1 hybrid sensor histidine kinase/response regulator [Bdellovibrio bacteriovorus]
MSYDGGVRKLVEVIQNLSAARSLDEITKLVRTAARVIADADGATFVLKDGDFCFYADEDAISPLWKGQRFPLESCVSGWAMLHKETVIIEDIYRDSRVPWDAYRPTFVKSMMMTPIRREDPIGAIGTYWKDQRLPTDEQRELLRALADSVSVSIENLNNYNDLQKRIEELKEANRSKDEFLMTVSHELRTPLNSIMGWAEILLESNPGDRDARLGLETIERNARNQTRIIEDLLDSSRILLGRFHMEKHPVDLVEVVNQTVDAVRLMAEKKDIHIEIAKGVTTAMIQGDAERLKQIVNNLLINAIKFSHAKSKVEVTVVRQGPSFSVSVKDEGVGMEPEFIPQAFERFRQADGSTTRKFGGLGLGLSISRHLVEAHQGTIVARSAGTGKGSEFSFSVPALSKQGEILNETPATPAPRNTKPLLGAHILVVDDDKDSLQVMETVLRINGADVVAADSVEEALRSQGAVDLIVCDLSMPGEDGFSFAHRIRAGETRFSRQVPMMALTAFVDKGSESKALGEGFDSFMGKPFAVPQLIRSLVELNSANYTH